MINLRMLAIAGALLLLAPVAALADPKSDVIEAGASAVAEIGDIILAEPAMNWTPASHDLVGEQLVEGHTTFVTMDALTNASPLEGNLTIDGFARCEHHGNVTYSWWNGIPYPTAVRDVRAECHVGERVVVTPTIYCTLTGNPTCGSSTSAPPPMFPTGDILEIVTPNGESAYAEELRFTATVETEDGGLEERTFYAWVTPVMLPWMGADVEPKNFRAKLPWARIQEMDEWRYSVIWESQIARA